MSAYNCPFKITDGLIGDNEGDRQDDNKKTASVPIEISKDLKIKKTVNVLDRIDNAYEVLIFLKHSTN